MTSAAEPQAAGLDTEEKDGMTTEDSSEATDGAVPAPACAAMVIFGGGDKSVHRACALQFVTVPRLSDGFRIVGVDLASLTTEVWRDNLTEMMNAFVAQGDASGATAWTRSAGGRFIELRAIFRAT